MDINIPAKRKGSYICVALRENAFTQYLSFLKYMLTFTFGSYTWLMRNLLSTLALLFTTGTLLSAEPNLTGTFTSLHFGTEDVTGAEISVVFGGDDYYVVVQCAEGEPGVPEVDVAHLHGATLSFQLSPKTLSGCPATEYHGTIDNNGLTGTFKQSHWPGFLKRGPSYWQ